MEKKFTISQTAKIVHMTTETLRHYDRIELIKPSKMDIMTKYRYYSEQDIVCLNTIRSLRCMDMSLNDIKEILKLNDFGEIASFLRESEKQADIKIAELNYAKSKIRTARLYYESKMEERAHEEIFIKEVKKRVILLSEKMNAPSLENLWDYHRHFYAQIGDSLKNVFSFEDLAGIYETQEQTHLFAVCTRYTSISGIKILPKGKYLCADCTENNRGEVLNKLLLVAKSQYNVVPEFIIQLIVLSGILKWNYQIQVFIGESEFLD